MYFFNDEHKWSSGCQQPSGLHGGTQVREWGIHKCTFSCQGRPHHATFPVQPVRARHSSPSLSLWAASWSCPSWSSWWACCWCLHTGPPSQCLSHRSRTPWYLVHSSWHSPSGHCFHWGHVEWQVFHPMRCSVRWPHGSAWVPRWSGNTSCELWCHEDKLEAEGSSLVHLSP